jgi:hypothetical protein
VKSIRSYAVVRLLSVTLPTLIGATLLAPPAHAEGWLIDGEAGLSTGLEGGDDGGGAIKWRRARTRVSVGVELRNDEEASHGYHFRAFAEIEKRGSVGGELRYALWPSTKFGVFAGAAGTVTPETLFGGVFGARLVLPMGKRVGIYVEPSFSVLPLGSDLPGDTPLYWALLSAGVRFGL